LASADDSSADDFTREQIQRFEAISSDLIAKIQYTPLRHVLNTAGISRFADAAYDMVRTGIGLYTSETPSARLLTRVSQIRKIKVGETVGYNRSWVAQQDAEIAVIPIGYADGFRRSLSNGVGKVLINGSQFTVVGKVCMDLTMVDVTGAGVKEGDEVEIFGTTLTLDDFARSCNTIPYEVLATVSSRVKRVYLWE
jgi:Alr-MurF fusion protein